MADLKRGGAAAGKSSGVFVHIMTLLTGRGAETIIAFLCMPVVTRLYLPADYGIAVSLISTATMLMPLATLTYERAIVFAQSDAEQFQLATLAWGSACLLSLLLEAVFGFGGFDWLSRFNAEFCQWLWLVPLYMICRATWVIVEQTAIKRCRYKKLAVAGIFDVCCSMAVRVAGGMVYGSQVLILAMAYLFGLSMRFLVGGIGGERTPGRWTSLRPDMLWTTAKYYHEYPQFQVWGSLFRTLSGNLPVVLLSIYYSSASAGVYAMSLAIARRPLETFLNSYRAVFLQRGALFQDHPAQFLAYFRKHTLMVCLTGLLPFTALGFFAPDIFPVLLGAKWTQAGEFVQIIAVWLYSLLISMPAVAAFAVLRRQQVWFKLSVLNALLQIGSLVWAHYRGDDIVLALTLYAHFGAVINLLTVLVAERLIIRRVKNG